MNENRETSPNKSNGEELSNSKDLKGSETEKNLYKTFAGESRARVKYELFAEKAKAEGYQWLSELFTSIGLNELAHARAAYKMFLGLVGSTLNNINEAVLGETEEYTKVYKEYEEIAQKEGFENIANFYKELQEVEESHAKTFKDLAHKLAAGTLLKGNSESKWCCMNCGYIYEGSEAPAACPLCKYPRGYFKKCCETNDL